MSLRPEQTTVDQVHELLCTKAAIAANADPRLPDYLTTPFRDAHNKSDKGGLCIDYDDTFLDRYDETMQQEIRSLLSTIALDAFRSTLATHRQLLVGLILGEGRNGHNYFRRFQAE